uniref:Alpha/beta hydrolase domain-containing protein n=1 Tax=Bionectria ochroleuca TaxID=29856 RepID=A0A8H7N2X9_BIOOC
MAVGNSNTHAQHVSVPVVAELPETEASRSVLLEPYHVDLISEYGYVSREYMISGIAAGESYCTRLLLRCPADENDFSGFVVEEPSHLWGGTSIWRHINRWLMRNGHAWLEVDSQAPSALGKIKAVDPERYKEMHFIPGPLSDEFADNIPFVTNVTKESLRDAYDSFKAKWWPATLQSPEILCAASHALRSGRLGLKADKVILSGLSQTGESHVGVKIIELLGESEFQSVRLPCGVSGQMYETSHRRPDSEGFRLYEVAGMAHRESRYASAIDTERLYVADLRGAKWSSFANSFIYHAVFQAMEKWVRGLAVPPASRMLTTVGDTDEIIRDSHGNALAGVRTLHTDAPLSRLVAATPKGRPNWYCGSEWPFSNKQLLEVYGSVSNYRRVAGETLRRQIQDGFLLLADAETLRRETVETVTF